MFNRDRVFRLERTHGRKRERRQGPLGRRAENEWKVRGGLRVLRADM